MGDQWELCNQGYIGGPLGWGTNENYVSRVTLGDQWYGGPLEWVVLIGGPMGLGADELGDQWDWEPMRRGTNGLGDHWDGPMKGWLMKRRGVQWDGEPVRRGTNEMGGQWVPIVHRGTNELGDRWEGDQWPMWVQWEGGPVSGSPNYLSHNQCELLMGIISHLLITVHYGYHNPEV